MCLFTFQTKVGALLQRPKELSERFDQEKDKDWFEKKILGYNSLENKTSWWNVGMKEIENF